MGHSEKTRLAVKGRACGFEGAIQNAFLRRDARQQFRSFARPNQVLRQSPSPTPTGFAKIRSEDLPGLYAHLKMR
jgi:hypothetical protein